MGTVNAKIIPNDLILDKEDLLTSPTDPDKYIGTRPDPFTDVLDHPALHDEVTIAALIQLCPEIKDLKKDKSVDMTAAMTLIAMSRLAAADPIEYRSEITLCAEVLRQRIESGMLGDLAAKHNREKELEPVVATYLRLEFGETPPPKKLRKYLMEHGFRRLMDETGVWKCISTPERKRVFDEVRSYQQDMLDKRAGEIVSTEASVGDNREAVVYPTVIPADDDSPY